MFILEIGLTPCANLLILEKEKSHVENMITSIPILWKILTQAVQDLQWINLKTHRCNHKTFT